MTIGDKIKALRKEKDMTLEELGQRVGVGASTVRKWEEGMIKNMRRDKIQSLADALGVSPGYLMGWEEKKPEQVDLVTENGTIVEASHGTGKNMDALRTFWEKLNDDGQDEAVRRLEELTELKKYRKEE